MPKQKELDNVFLECAKLFANLSKAKRLKVGSVLVKNNRIACCGYNGTPTGYNNKCEDLINGQLVTKDEVIHAESNLLMAALADGISTEGCSIYLTHSPCFECAKLIVQAKIKKVYYEVPYRVTDSLVFLTKCKVKVIKIGE